MAQQVNNHAWWSEFNPPEPRVEKVDTLQQNANWTITHETLSCMYQHIHTTHIYNVKIKKFYNMDSITNMLFASPYHMIISDWTQVQKPVSTQSLL